MASSSLLLLLLSLYLSLFASTSKAAESILLSEPITSNGPETLLICIPGMSVPATEYVPSCLAIQNNLPFRTWVAVMSFRGNVVNPASIEKGFDMAIEAVQKAGFSNVTNSDIFVWAHSAGGPFSADLVAARQYSGFILYGSYITSYPLLEYPVPFISVGGELDGLAQTSRVAEDYRVCRDLIRAGKREEAVSRKAVVVAEGMNHALMCNNYIQGLIAEEDFEAEITLEQALADIGRVSAAFIQIHRTQGLNGPAYQLISDLIDFSDQVFGGFLEAQDDDKGVWCTRTQTLVANLNDPSLHNLVNVEEPDFDAFVDSKASLTVTNGIAYITTHSFQNFSRISGEVGVYSEGETALEVGCKMKSQDSILDKLKNPAHGVAGTCKEAHNAMIDLALKRVSPSIRERYALKGRQLLFLEDVLQSRGDLWVDSHLIFDDSVTPVEVTASRLYSANIPTEFGGATYCKMLSAAKVFSWIMHDSLPRGLSMK